LTDDKKSPRLSRKALSALATWVANKNEDNKYPRMEHHSVGTTTSSDFSVGKDGSEPNKKIAKAGGKN
jgi:hypothetical protein